MAFRSKGILWIPCVSLIVEASTDDCEWDLFGILQVLKSNSNAQLYKLLGDKDSIERMSTLLKYKVQR